MKLIRAAISWVFLALSVWASWNIFFGDPMSRSFSMGIGIGVFVGCVALITLIEDVRSPDA